MSIRKWVSAPLEHCCRQNQDQAYFWNIVYISILKFFSCFYACTVSYTIFWLSLLKPFFIPVLLKAEPPRAPVIWGLIWITVWLDFFFEMHINLLSSFISATSGSPEECCYSQNTVYGPRHESFHLQILKSRHRNTVLYSDPYCWILLKLSKEKVLVQMFFSRLYSLCLFKGEMAECMSESEIHHIPPSSSRRILYWLRSI